MIPSQSGKRDILFLFSASRFMLTAVTRIPCWTADLSNSLEPPPLSYYYFLRKHWNTQALPFLIFYSMLSLKIWRALRFLELSALSLSLLLYKNTALILKRIIRFFWGRSKKERFAKYICSCSTVLCPPMSQQWDFPTTVVPGCKFCLHQQ
jgi:hypothetical protein